jgi:hypothetical protein
VAGRAAWAAIFLIQNGVGAYGVSHEIPMGIEAKRAYTAELPTKAVLNFAPKDIIINGVAIKPNCRFPP